MRLKARPAIAEATTRITHELVEKYTKELKNRKAPGIDQLNNELIKYESKPLSEQPANLYQKILNKTTIPTDWKKSITIPIFKKGDKKQPGNYREITYAASSQNKYP